MLFATSKENHNQIKPTVLGDRAVCPSCKEEVLAKCGEIKIWHWAHFACTACEFGRPETEWHLRNKEWWLQKGAKIEEPVGVRIIDVKFKNVGLEFQRKTDTLEEMRSRTENHLEHLDFLIWVVPERKMKIIKRHQENVKIQFAGAQQVLHALSEEFGESISLIVGDTDEKWFLIKCFYLKNSFADGTVAFGRDMSNDILFFALKEEIGKNFKFETFKTHRPEDSLVLSFGKYAGESIKDIPTSYLKWILSAQEKKITNTYEVSMGLGVPKYSKYDVGFLYRNFWGLIEKEIRRRELYAFDYEHPDLESIRDYCRKLKYGLGE
jgi:hypothetical protein